MSYRILILPRAQRQLAHLAPTVYSRVKEGILRLAVNPRPPGSLRLTGREGWRIRIGDYRVVYRIDDDECSVTVLDVGHRGDVI